MHNLIIGETCLLSVQLRRLQLIEGKNELFDNMLVTIDGVLSLVQDDFVNILNDQYLRYANYTYYPEHCISYPKWINTKYSVHESSIFSWPVFSFFHYDSFNNEQKSSIIRKTARFKQYLEDNEAVNFFYYYREGPNYNILKIVEKCSTFLDFFAKKYNKEFNIYLFTKTSGKKAITYAKHSKIHHFTFASPYSWIGIDDNWDGHSDNDLFDTFLQKYNSISS